MTENDRCLQRQKRQNSTQEKEKNWVKLRRRGMGEKKKRTAEGNRSAKREIKLSVTTRGCCSEAKCAPDERAAPLQP